MLFSFPRHRQPPLSAVDGWCDIAPSWLVIERCDLPCLLHNIAPYVLVSASRAAESVRMGPDEPFIKAKVVGWSFLQATRPTFVYSSCSRSYNTTLTLTPKEMRLFLLCLRTGNVNLITRKR